MGFLSKWRQERREYLIFSPKLGRFTLMTLAWQPGLAKDDFNKRAWELAPDLKTYLLKIGKKEKRVNILDEERGIGLNLELDESLLKIKSNPELSGQLIDAVLITTAMQLTPSNKKVIIGFVIGLLIGLIFGSGM